jgi:CheY-like chemotaxis protein
VLLERVDSHVEISVIDTGMGIRPEFLPHVFERFRQADSSTTRRHGGLGLGLTIVKQLVELHGGSVRVKSPGDCQRATSIVSLPLVSDIGMPEQDGYDLIRQVRSRLTAKTLPAVGLTAFARSEDRRRALLAGFQTHVAKPAEPEELVAIVASLAERTGGQT